VWGFGVVRIGANFGANFIKTGANFFNFTQSKKSRHYPLILTYFYDYENHTFNTDFNIAVKLKNYRL